MHSPQIKQALNVRHHFESVHIEGAVIFAHLIVEFDVIAKARTSPALDAHPKENVWLLVCNQLPYMLLGCIC